MVSEVMAESTLRRPDPLIFDENIAENFRKFEQDWEVYLNAGLSGKSKKVQAYTLLNFAGTEATEKCRSFVYAEEVKNQDNEVVTAAETKEDPDVLLKKFKEICTPQKNIIIERHTFNTRNQKEGESFSSYLADLKIKASTCEFQNLKDELIRDRIVCGIRDGDVRKELLKERKLTLKSAMDICKSNEQSAKHSKELKNETSEVHSLHQRRRKGNGKGKSSRTFNPQQRNPQQQRSRFSQDGTCSSCGGKHGQKREDCYAFGQQCNVCNKWNHYARQCRQNPQGNSQPQRSQGGAGNRTPNGGDTGNRGSHRGT
jgi:hypothetical protein